MWLVALITAATVLATSLVATAQTGEPQIRINARILNSGRIEVALQQRPDGGDWGDRLLPARRFLPASAPTGRWLWSTPLEVQTAAGPREMRIAARRPAGGGRIEVGLQQRRSDGAWSEVILPGLRVVPAGAPEGRWLGSSPLHEPAFREQAAGGPAGRPEDEGSAGLPSALLTPTGVPVAVIGRAGAGYLVRTPCGNAAEVTGGDPIDGMRVVLDPGHGGPFEVGAVGPNGLPEDELNLTLSRAILAELARRGISTTTTRTGDYGSLLSVRAAFADAVGADVLISLHHNGPTRELGDSPGTEVYIQSDDDETPRSDSARLGGLLYEEITAALGMFADVSWSRLPDAGVLRVLFPDGGDAYGMISRPAVPAVLVEYGYLSNTSEAELFATDDYISIAAVATANAIEDYLNTDRPGSGIVEQPRRFDPAGAPSRCAEVALE
ncbi:MAG: N-acetylmuramoyl-L-alanine amidase [bacterium]|nr:N-acetylmuramoyl-L-alanine amidase [bacterium]